MTLLLQVIAFTVLYYFVGKAVLTLGQITPSAIMKKVYELDLDDLPIDLETIEFRAHIMWGIMVLIWPALVLAFVALVIVGAFLR